MTRGYYIPVNMLPHDCAVIEELPSAWKNCTGYKALNSLLGGKTWIGPPFQFAVLARIKQL